MSRRVNSIRPQDYVLRLINDVVDDVAKIVPFLEFRDLAVGAGTARENLARIVDVVARSELIDNVVDELEQFVEQHGVVDLLALAEVDELAADAEACGAL